MKMTRRFSLYLSLFIVWTFLLLSTLFFLHEIDNKKAKSANLLQQSILQEAGAHFKNILDTRKWNASHDGIFVRDDGIIKPNPYLQDNVLKTEDNQTLIKINPAWMTRQISEIANKDNSYYYKITSLKPINPDNQADAFEKEALEFFEKNKDTEIYYSFSKNQKGKTEFDFMGSLKVAPKCMQCHEYQGYAVGDIRGGIRVSLPTNIYNQSLEALEKEAWEDKGKTMLFALIVGLLLSAYMRKSLLHTLEVEELNRDLEEKVRVRTQELYEINETLEERVQEEIQKNRLKEAAMLTQSRYAAMGEMISMLAHQWRQPIAVINMQISNILVDIELGSENIEEINNELVNISNETQKLSQIIASFSDLFDSGAEKRVLKPEDVLEDILSLMSASLEAYTIEVRKEYASDTMFTLASKNLFQVYWNILGNALEMLHRKKIQEPFIEIKVYEDENAVITQISDNAGGIKEEAYEKIFEPYYSTNKNLNGKGLGLYIAKTLIEKELGGSISVKNSAVGADFFIRIPKI
jgi:signal transduction histidine kinase